MFNGWSVPFHGVHEAVLEWQIEAGRPSWKGRVNNPNMKHWDVDGIMPMESNLTFHKLLGSLTVGLND